MNRTLELLKMMRGKIATGWTKGCSARNQGGFPVVPYSQDACQWCLIGSMTAHEPYLNYFEARSLAAVILRNLIADRNDKPDIEMYNDSEMRTHGEVLELLDEAIQVASVGGYQ